MINNYDSLIEKYHTPLYVYDIRKLRNRIRYIKKNINNKYRIIYAVKANTFILKGLDDLIDGYEICSYGEYEICKNNNLNNNKFIISGVNKDKNHIEIMLNDNTLKYTIESINQFELLKDLSKKKNKNIELLIRLTSGNQFGVTENEFIEIAKSIETSKNIKLKGIEYFSGTQKSSIKKINKEIDYLCEFINNLENEYNIFIEEVEYGTGSPVFYFKEDEFDEKEYFNELNKSLSKIKDKKISLEIGRSIVASCGDYITSIVDMKSNKYGNSIILDGGINHLVYYGQTMAMRIPYFDVYPTRKENKNIYNLYGSLCTINDIVLKNIELCNPKINDYFVFKNVGAYSSTEGISLFLSRNLPRIIIKDTNDNYVSIREDIKTSKMNEINEKEMEYEIKWID